MWVRNICVMHPHLCGMYPHISATCVREMYLVLDHAPGDLADSFNLAHVSEPLQCALCCRTRHARLASQRLNRRTSALLVVVVVVCQSQENGHRCAGRLGMVEHGMQFGVAHTATSA